MKHIFCLNTRVNALVMTIVFFIQNLVQLFHLQYHITYPMLVDAAKTPIHTLPPKGGYIRQKHQSAEVPISYPKRTSVELPSHPLFPAVDIKNVHDGSMYSWEMTPVLWPGMMRNGT